MLMFPSCPYIEELVMRMNGYFFLSPYQFLAMTELPRGLRIFFVVLDWRTGARPERRFLFWSSRPIFSLLRMEFELM